MSTKSFNRRLVCGLVASLAALGFGPPDAALAQIIRPIECDIVDLADLTLLLTTDAGQPGVAGTGGVYLTRNGAVQWSYNPTSGAGALKNPSAAEALGNGEVAIADTGNHRVLIVNQAGQITWNSATVTFSDGRLLRGPVDVRIIPDGTPSMTDNQILITCKDSNRVAAVRRTGQVVWAMNTGLNAPQKAERLPNGNTLIADTGNHRVLEVNAQRQIVQSLSPTQTPAPVSITAAERLPDGSTLILDSANGELYHYNAGGQFVSIMGGFGQLKGATDMDVVGITDLAILFTSAAGVWLNPLTY